MKPLKLLYQKYITQIAHFTHNRKRTCILIVMLPILLILAFIFVKPLSFSQTPPHPIRFAFTIDVEDKNGAIPNLIECDLGEYGSFGIDYILETLQKYNFKATFFVNVYEENLYSGVYENYIEELLQKIDSTGHEVALHGHHSRERDYYSKPLNEYTYEEQNEIIAKGCSIIEQAIHKSPVSFRAGGFAINDNTFKALQNNGILYDSSAYYGRESNTFEWYHSLNQTVKIDTITEFPLIYSINTRGKKTVLDLNSMSYNEIISILQQMQKRENFNTAQIIFHSFSFIDQKESSGKEAIFEEPGHIAYGPDYETIEKFEQLLEYASQDTYIEIVPLNQLVSGNDSSTNTDSQLDSNSTANDNIISDISNINTVNNINHADDASDAIFHTNSWISYLKAKLFVFNPMNPHYKQYPAPELLANHIQITNDKGKIVCTNEYPKQYNPKFAWYLIDKTTNEAILKTEYSNDNQISLDVSSIYSNYINNLNDTLSDTSNNHLNPTSDDYLDKDNYNILAFVVLPTGERFSIEISP